MAVRSIARAYIITSLRERITLFWFLAFPLLLLVLLTFVFGNVGNSVRTSFDVTLVNFDDGRDARAAAALAGAMATLAATEDGTAPLFVLHLPPVDADRSAFLVSELNELRVGRRAVVVEIPLGLSASVDAAARGAASATLAVEIHKSGGRTGSDMAASIVEHVVAGVDRSLLVQYGLFDESRTLRVERLELGAGARTFRYVDFLLPGILLMGFFTGGLFGVPGTLLFGRERRILRGYWVTPLDVPHYLAGFALGHLGLCAIQFACVWGVARFALGADVPLWRPLVLAALLFAAMTFLAIGFLVAAVARTANGGMALANVVNMPMMFLGGLFFPIGQLPGALRAVMLANPVTYLADLLRGLTGTAAPVLPVAASVGVPLAWIVVCALVAARRLQWDVSR
ncbi:MAG: ABC transporter permease [Candidatus Bipolaricaulota bacterium]